MTRNVFEIGSKLQIIANWNFDQAYIPFFSFAAFSAFSARGYNSANALHQPLKRLTWPGARLRSSDRIKKNSDANVSRREFDDSRNGGVLQLLKRAENLVQCFLRRIIKLVAQAHDQRRISKSCNLHARKDRLARRILVGAVAIGESRSPPANSFWAKQLRERLRRALLFRQPWGARHGSNHA